MSSKNTFAHPDTQEGHTAPTFYHCNSKIISPQMTSGSTLFLLLLNPSKTAFCLSWHSLSKQFSAAEQQNPINPQITTVPKPSQLFIYHLPRITPVRQSIAARKDTITTSKGDTIINSSGKASRKRKCIEPQRPSLPTDVGTELGFVLARMQFVTWGSFALPMKRSLL
ncbi:hypothetical protein CEXT_2401 [Caerostris extrusa]|uniref:Uncharacterized protein n=1 Tax=Caerostris extrusa TaxID=172846 RepID=A0AAV4P4B4_CAEEX|nr:hypothetical protein CEXT_2401 [Caerostris extrusa]